MQRRHDLAQSPVVHIRGWRSTSTRRLSGSELRWQNCSRSLSRSKKARTTALSLTDVAPLQGGVGVENPSLDMSSLIEAADSALKEAGRGVL